MKNWFLASVIISLACALSLPAFAQANAPAKPLTPQEQTLMAAEKSYVEAAKKGDLALFKRTLTDDFSFVAFDGQLYDRQDLIDQASMFTEMCPCRCRMGLAAEAALVQRRHVGRDCLPLT